jgi:hypothetical protein
MTRISAVLTLCLGAVTVTALGAAQVVVTETQVTTQLPGGPIAGGGRGALAPMAIGTGLIMGQAVDAASARPIPGVLVTLSLSGTSPLRAMADGQGRFAFQQLPKGRYNITISRAGYVDGAYGRLRPGGPTQSIDLDDGERVGNITIPIWKFAAVGGFVTDERNEPIVGAQVRVLKRSIVGGQWRLVAGPTDMTDDRGAFRIGALEPGEYVVVVPMSQPSPFTIEGITQLDGNREVVALGGAVSAVRVAAVAGGGGPITLDTALSGGTAVPPPDENGRPQAYPTQFYPAASTSTRAAAITVGSGEERVGLDFQLKPVRTMKVSGMASGPEGPAANMPVSLVPSEADDLATPIETLTAVTDGAGSFTFQAVPAGSYILRATRTPRGGAGSPATFVQQGGGMIVTRSISVGGPGAPLPTEPTLWAETALAVGAEDIGNVVLSLQPGLKVTGQVAFDGTAQRPTPEQIASIFVSLEAADPKPGMQPTVRGRVEANGQFQTMTVPPGRYFVRVPGGPAGWTFRGAMLAGQDISDTPIEIESGDLTGVMLTFTDRPSELSGTVSTAGTAGSEAGAATVIVFPADQAAWIGYGSQSRRLRNLRVDKTGSFTAQNLPPGDYLVAAVPDKDAGDWQNPKFLAELASSATRVRIAQGDKVTQNLQVVR